MRLFAVGLDLPANHFDPLIDESPSAMRAINYPAHDVAPQPGQLRAGAHTDYGTMTILRQDDAPGGLEVRSPHDARRVPIPSVPGAFVVNVGDLLARWTNDRWRSTMHRVVNPPIEPGRDTGARASRSFTTPTTTPWSSACRRAWRRGSRRSTRPCSPGRT